MEDGNAVLELVEPDIEVIVRSGEQEIAIIGIFQNKSNVWDILVGVDEVDRANQLSSLFEAILLALPLASFTSARTAEFEQRSFLAEERGDHYAKEEKPRKR